MPAVTMRRQISGKRNSRDWPKPGQTIDVPDDEARTLVRLGLATTDGSEPANQDEPTEEDETGAEADEQSDEQSEDDHADNEDADGEPADEADESEPADESDDLDSMKLPELRELAAERGLPTSGNKPALIERLRGE